MAAGESSGIGLVEIQSINMDVQDHDAGRIAYGRIRIGQGVVEEPNDLVIGFLGGSSFLRVNGAEYNKHGGIHGNGIVQ